MKSIAFGWATFSIVLFIAWCGGLEFVRGESLAWTLTMGVIAGGSAYALHRFCPLA